MMKNRCAFTLLELMIASSVFAVIMVSIFTAFRTGIFSQRNIETTIDTYQTARTVFEQINRDLRNCFAYEDKDGHAKFTGNLTEVSFLTLVDTYGAEVIVPEFAQVSYNTTSEAGTVPQKNRLLRLCKRNLEAISVDSQVQPEEMADGAALELRYYGYMKKAGKNNEELQFENSWGQDPQYLEERNKLPIAVEATLTLTLPDGKTEQKFKRTIYLPLAKYETP